MTAQYSVIATGLGFPEAPVALENGDVLLAEVRRGRVTRIDRLGVASVHVECGGGPCGLAVGPDDGLYICNTGGNRYRPGFFMSIGPAEDYRGGLIQRHDPLTGEVATLYSECDGRRLSAPNDLVFDAAGGFYFSDIGKRFARHRDNGAIYYATCDGSGVREVAFNVAAANGVALSPDGSVLYVAETETARLWAFDVLAPGVLRKLPYPSPHGGRFVCGLGGYQRFDSMAVDADGRICIATLMSGCVTVVAPSGEILSQVILPDSYVTNLCFGGPGLRTAYVTLAETGRLAAVPWSGGGLALNFGPASCLAREAHAAVEVST